MQLHNTSVVYTTAVYSLITYVGCIYLEEPQHGISDSEEGHGYGRGISRDGIKPNEEEAKGTGKGILMFLHTSENIVW